jgi:transcription antitermination factor NusG
VNTRTQLVGSDSLPIATIDAPEARWYAVRTRSRHEKVAARELVAQGINVFLPLISSVRQWSDRRTKVEIPLFPGYAFVRVGYLSSERVRVLRATGVVSFVGQNPVATWIPDEQIESIRTILLRGVPVKDHPFLGVGQRVRVKSGSLCGVEGILVGVKGSRTLVISVQPIQRSLCISLDDYEVEKVDDPSAAADHAAAR